MQQEIEKIVDFDTRAAFRELWRVWRHRPNFRKEEEWGLDTFKKNVYDQRTFELILEAARNCMLSLGGQYYSQGLPQFIRSGWESFNGKSDDSSSKSVDCRTINIQVAVPNIVLDRVDSTFDRVWAIWPRNESRPEKEQAALSAWRSAADKHKLEDLELAANHYSLCFLDPSEGMLHPKHLRNFVTDEDMLWSWTERARIAPTPREISEFEAAYTIYPEFEGKNLPNIRRDALVFWRRHIKSIDRLDFLLAVRAYKRKRSQEIKEMFDGEIDISKFTKHWPRFVAEWKETKIAREVADALSIPLTNKALELDIIDITAIYSGEWLHGAIYYTIQEKKVSVQDGITEVLSIIFKKSKIDMDPAALAKTVCDEVYAAACQDLKKVVG